jgi:cellulose biosynthesis protein BcsQ
MKSLAFFSIKGGVGTTTLACNMASHLAENLQLSVLFVDTDPQCDATRLLLPQELCERLYGNRRGSQRRTLLKVLRRIWAGDLEIDHELDIEASPRFGVDVLPGHPSLATVEDRLSSSWVEFQAGDLDGARRCAWVGTLVAAAPHDLVIFDVGPSLGALNRSVLLACEAFVTPMAADPFSLYAFDDISDWIDTWSRDYERAYESLPEGDRPWLGRYGLSPSPYVRHAFAGFTVQQNVGAAMGTEYGSVRTYDRYRRQILERATSLDRFRRPSEGDPDLGVVPDMSSMIPLAQAVHAPIRDLKMDDGLRGAQASQQPLYMSRLEAIAYRLAENLGL